MRVSHFRNGVVLACMLLVAGIATAVSAHAQSDRPPIFDYVPNVVPRAQSDAELKALNQRVIELYQAGTAKQCPLPNVISTQSELSTAKIT